MQPSIFYTQFVCTMHITKNQGWKISWYFRKYRKYPIFSIYIPSICTYIAKIIWNLLSNKI